MPTRIRLQRKGKKGMPFYHVVIADGRAPRDGKFIERIGIYNPVSKPAVIDINFERALYWLQAGAEPSDTVNALLSYKGVNYKHHLLKGVKKGAMTEEIAEAKFLAWQNEKQEKFIAKLKETELSGKDSKKKKLEAEMKVNEERARELQAKRAKELKAQQAAENEEETTEAVAAAEEAVAEAEPVIEEAAVVAEEVAVVEEPAVEEPEVAVEEPEVAAEEPEVAAEEPEVAAEEPEVAAEETAVVAEEAVAEAAPAAEEAPATEEPAAEEETETKA